MRQKRGKLASLTYHTSLSWKMLKLFCNSQSDTHVKRSYIDSKKIKENIFTPSSEKSAQILLSLCSLLLTLSSSKAMDKMHLTNI